MGRGSVGGQAETVQVPGYGATVDGDSEAGQFVGDPGADHLLFRRR